MEDIYQIYDSYVGTIGERRNTEKYLKIQTIGENEEQEKKILDMIRILSIHYQSEYNIVLEITNYYMQGNENIKKKSEEERKKLRRKVVVGGLLARIKRKGEGSIKVQLRGIKNKVNIQLIELQKEGYIDFDIMSGLCKNYRQMEIMMNEGFNKDHLKNLINEIEKQEEKEEGLRIEAYLFITMWESEEEEGEYEYVYKKRGIKDKVRVLTIDFTKSECYQKKREKQGILEYKKIEKIDEKQFSEYLTIRQEKY